MNKVEQTRETRDLNMKYVQITCLLWCKIKFDIKINFFNIKRIGYLWAKKNKKLNWIFKINFKVVNYLTYFYHSIHLFFNLTLSSKKKKLFSANLGLK